MVKVLPIFIHFLLLIKGKLTLPQIIPILLFHIIHVDFRKNYGQPDSNTERQLISRSSAVASGPPDWNEALDIISFGSPEQVK